MKKAILILGIGPGLGLAVAEKFGKEGYTIGMVSRTTEKLEHYHAHLSGLGITSFYAIADLANTEQMLAAIGKLTKNLSKVDVLMYNAVDYRIKHILEENIEDLTNGFKISIGNVLVAVKELLPQLEKNKGAVLLTGGGSANYPDASMGSISLGKAGIKSLAYQLNHALASKAVYVGTVTVSDWINPDSKTHAPKMIAEKFWEMNTQRRETEIIF